jgi:large subunit ribosomal protein L15
MLRLDNLKPAPGSRHRRKIIGRGEGSGHGGKGSTRGFKGQTARSGDRSMRPGFEGGQKPLMMRIPKRGFSNRDFKKFFETVNVGDIEAVFPAGGEVTVEAMKKARLVRRDLPVKILGDGDLTKKFSVSADAFTVSAKAKIEKAGGAAVLLVKKPAADAASKK